MSFETIPTFSDSTKMEYSIFEFFEIKRCASLDGEHEQTKMCTAEPCTFRDVNVARRRATLT